MANFLVMWDGWTWGDLCKNQDKQGKKECIDGGSHHGFHLKKEPNAGIAYSLQPIHNIALVHGDQFQQFIQMIICHLTCVRNLKKDSVQKHIVINNAFVSNFLGIDDISGKYFWCEWWNQSFNGTNVAFWLCFLSYHFDICYGIEFLLMWYFWLMRNVLDLLS